MAGIRQLPVVEVTCANCEHAMFGSRGIYCETYEEDIWNERSAAADCPMYDPMDGHGEAEIIGLTERRAT